MLLSDRIHARLRADILSGALAPGSAVPSERRLAEQYGAWGEKSMYGKTYMGVMRSTFIIDAEGTVVHVIPKASPKTHDDDVLAVLAAVA